MCCSLILFINPVTYSPFLLFEMSFCLKAEIEKAGDMKCWEGSRTIGLSHVAGGSVTCHSLLGNCQCLRTLKFMCPGTNSPTRSPVPNRKGCTCSPEDINKNICNLHYSLSPKSTGYVPNVRHKENGYANCGMFVQWTSGHWSDEHKILLLG